MELLSSAPDGRRFTAALGQCAEAWMLLSGSAFSLARHL